MRMLAFIAPVVIACSPFVCAADPLTPEESAAGWRVLFDGTSTAGFRGFKQAGFPSKGWVIEDGALKVEKGGGGGDIVTLEQYEDFELSLDFRCSVGANSGIMYRCSEANDYPWMTGPEFQVLDDEGHKDGLDAKHSVGALYDMIAAPADKPKVKPEEWHSARIRIRNGVLQHYLDNVKVIETRIDDDHWKEMIAGSKFKQWPGFGLEKKGYLALQDHGDTVWYRNIKVRDLSAPMAGQKLLFDGKTMAGWKAVVPDLAKEGKDQAAVWSVKDGVLACRGTPAGYVRTEQAYSNYVLKLEWRWVDAGAKDPNSGVLLRVVGEDKVWPKSIEAQLAGGHAGDFWNIDSVKMTTDVGRLKGRNTRHTHANERPVGEWNEYEIIVHKGDVSLRVNGDEVNRAWDCEEVPGFIALQSEGAPIEFRNVRLVEVK
ncbi:MAG: DUF1080 domain-containing protein [Phycisphaerales bacterium]